MPQNRKTLVGKRKRRRKKIFFILSLGVMAILLGIWVGKVLGQPSATSPSSTNLPAASTKSSSPSSTTPSPQTGTSLPQEKTPEKKLTEYVEKMPLDLKLGQVFLARVPEENQLTDLAQYHLGGYLLFGKDVAGENLTTLKEKIQTFQTNSWLPLFIGSDEEGGSVSRLSYAGLVDPPFPSPATSYANGGLENVKADWVRRSQILKEVGIQLPLAPVADFTQQADSFMANRTLQQDLKTTETYLKTVVELMMQEKIGSTLKHFPGYGDNGDSHTEIVTDSRSLEEIKTSSLPLFSAGISAGADSVLVAHNIVEAIDGTKPASISKPVHDLLRNDLGFSGVIMTDDLDMKGLSDFISQDEAALAALVAGNDLILSSSYATQIPYLKQAITKGTYSVDELNQHVFRILLWKVKLGLLDMSQLPNY